MLHLRAKDHFDFQKFPEENGKKIAFGVLKAKGDTPWAEAILDFQGLPAHVLLSVTFQVFFRTLQEQESLEGITEAVWLTTHAFQKTNIQRWHTQFLKVPEDALIYGGSLYLRSESICEKLIETLGDVEGNLVFNFLVDNLSPEKDEE